MAKDIIFYDHVFECQVELDIIEILSQRELRYIMSLIVGRPSSISNKVCRFKEARKGF